jgi:hypothetical protein
MNDASRVLSTTLADFFSILLGTCSTLPSSRGEGGAAGCEAAGPEKPEVYSLGYIEDFSGPRTTQMVADHSP